MRRVGKRLGDTLIEVTIAVGIFSLVAVAVVSVVSSSTSGAQANLETTVTREEIDMQAEALRFIQSAYINETSGGDNYANVWKTIVDEGNLSTVNESFTPSTCSAIYDKPEDSELKNAFIINYRELSSGDPDKIVLKASDPDHQSMFTMAQTFPRLVFDNKTDSGSILDADSFAFKTLRKAEGIYVIVARDVNSTTIAEGDVTKQSSAYYDFYIRSCWYAASNSTPSTISTVIRLYDPDIVSEGDPIRGKSEWGITYHSSEVTNLCTDDSDPAIPTSDNTKNYKNWPSGAEIIAGGTGNLHKNTFTKKGYTFIGWCSEAVSRNSPDVCNGTTYANEAEYTIPLSLKQGATHFYAMWKKNDIVKITYDGNKATVGTTQTIDYRKGCTVKVLGNWFKKNGHSWIRWNTNKDDSGTKYGKNATFIAETNLTLFAIWKPRYYNILYDGNGNTSGNTKDDKKYLAGSQITLQKNGFVKEPTNNKDYYEYSFNGWKCTEGCGFITPKPTSSTIYDQSNKGKTKIQTVETDPNEGTIKMQAQWKETKYFIVKYHANGGSGNEYQQKSVVGNQVTILENKFTRNNYTFVGWCHGAKTDDGATAQDCATKKGTFYKKGDKIVSNSPGPLNLYAMWKKSCDSTTRSWSFSGEVKAFQVPAGCSGYYRLKVWGARGGSDNGGVGGYADGKVYLAEKTWVYIAVGGSGSEGGGGFNGGGAGGTTSDGGNDRYGGGGATHIGKKNQQLSSYSWNTKSDLYIVAGGGGGAVYNGADGSQIVKDGVAYCPDICVTKYFPQATNGGYGTNGYNGCLLGLGNANVGTGGWEKVTKVSLPQWIKGGNGSGGAGGQGNIPYDYGVTSSCEKEDNYTASCKEKFARKAQGGGTSKDSGGKGTWATNHYDPPENGQGNGQGGNHGNWIGETGSFGKGGSNVISYGRTAKGFYNTASNPYQQGSSLAGGGGGGFYGGGAGSPTGCHPSSGGGGSGYVDGLTDSHTKTGYTEGNPDKNGNGYAQIIGPE